MLEPGQPSAPLSDTVIVALGKLIDDAGKDRRDPSHSDLAFQFERTGLSIADPAKQGQTVGKAKRVRAVLTWAAENAPNKGERLVWALLAAIRGCGGFRPGSPNYAGHDAIVELTAAFKEEGALLASDGVLTSIVSEFQFRFNARYIDDGARTALAIRKAEGKRLMYSDSSLIS